MKEASGSPPLPLVALFAMSVGILLSRNVVPESLSRMRLFHWEFHPLFPVALTPTWAPQASCFTVSYEQHPVARGRQPGGSQTPGKLAWPWGQTGPLLKPAED